MVQRRTCSRRHKRRLASKYLNTCFGRPAPKVPLSTFESSTRYGSHRMPSLPSRARGAPRMGGGRNSMDQRMDRVLANDNQLRLMWLNEGRLEDARSAVEAARRLLPAAVPAQWP